MSGHVDDDLRTAVQQAFSEPCDVPDLAAKVTVLHRRRRTRRIAVGASVAAVAAVVGVAAATGGLLTGSTPTGHQVAGTPDVHRLPLVPSVLAWGYQGSAAEDLDPKLLPRAETLWRGTTAGRGAQGTATLATLFAVPPGSPDAASVSLLQFGASGNALWVGFAVETAGQITLQGLQPFPAEGVGEVSALLQLPTGHQFVVVAGPPAFAGSVTVSGTVVRLTSEGGGVFSAPAATPPSHLTLEDASGAVLYAGRS